jgi:hypothetical protein
MHTRYVDRAFLEAVRFQFHDQAQFEHERIHATERAARGRAAANRYSLGSRPEIDPVEHAAEHYVDLGYEIVRKESAISVVFLRRGDRRIALVPEHTPEGLVYVLPVGKGSRRPIDEQFATLSKGLKAGGLSCEWQIFNEDRLGARSGARLRSFFATHEKSGVMVQFVTRTQPIFSEVRC